MTIQPDFVRQRIAEAQKVVRQALAELLKVQPLAEAHNYVVTEMHRLDGAV